MAHILILGSTQSGKTTHAKKLIQDYKAKGIKTIVYDKLTADPSWQADFVTDDRDEFLSTFWSSQQCMVFIDEAGDAIEGMHDTKMRETATKGRHWGHLVHYISQRATMIPKTIRDQCTHLFLFTSSLADAKIHADEWNSEELKNASTLKQGEYYHTTRFDPVTKHKLF